MFVEISDPGYDWTAVIVTGSIVGVLLIAAILLTVLGRNVWNWDEDIFGGLWVLWFFVFISVGLLGGGLTGSLAYESRVLSAVSKELYVQGFEKIDISGDPTGFTASLNGKYFDGAFVKVGNLKWQLVEIEE